MSWTALDPSWNQQYVMFMNLSTGWVWDVLDNSKSSGTTIDSAQVNIGSTITSISNPQQQCFQLNNLGNNTWTIVSSIGPMSVTYIEGGEIQNCNSLNSTTQQWMFQVYNAGTANEYVIVQNVDEDNPNNISLREGPVQGTPLQCLQQNEDWTAQWVLVTSAYPWIKGQATS